MDNKIISRSNEMTLDSVDLFKRSQDKTAFNIRVACPAIIQSVDFKKQTLTAKIAITERKVNKESKKYEWLEIPELLDVPFFFPFGGDYSITFPIKADDECLVVFADSCIDSWWQQSGIQNPITRRRHSLSDAFAIVGFRSQPNVLQNYSSDSLRIRNKDNSVYVEVKNNDIKAFTENGSISAEAANEIVLKAKNITLDATQGIDIKANGQTQIEGKNFLQHTHGGVENGAGSTLGVN